ncbi:MAG: RHS repeat-associated core domain-containing protein [Leptothrix ochracea]|uniref:RHS repeat-associated core domain-containing protein n=2 Tax=Leptothrix ochracea TaxID=735331 RepID=UPI0034E2AA4D
MPGQIFDKETGLHHNGHRDYNPATGRYIQPDPIGLEGGINRYGYVGGNPVSRIDPRGLTTVVVLSGSVSSNPFGHIGVATTGSGVYSYGTADPYGGSFSNYLAGQLANRSVQIVVLPTSPEQEAAIQASMRTNSGGYSWNSNNCATTTGTALNSAGLPMSPDPSILPGKVFNDALSVPGATYMYLPKGSAVPSALLPFNPK